MKNIKTILTEAGIELTDEQIKGIEKSVLENYKTVEEFNSKTERLTSERDSFKQQYESAKKSLDSFEGVDVEDLKKQIAEAQTAAKEAEESASARLKERDYMDAVKAQVSGLAFSSNSAKEHFIAKLAEKKLPVENGKLLGFDDYVTAYKTSDEGAIVDKEAAESRAKFTDPMQGGGGGGIKDVAELNKMRSVMGLAPIKED